MKFIYIVLGFLCLAIGVIGVLLPLLPTTPFLLLSAYCFSKGSEKIHGWFMETRIYDKYLKEFLKNREMTLKSKISILSLATVMMISSFFVMPNIFGRITLIGLGLYMYYYFFNNIKTATHKKDH